MQTKELMIHRLQVEQMAVRVGIATDALCELAEGCGELTGEDIKEHLYLITQLLTGEI